MRESGREAWSMRCLEGRNTNSSTPPSAPPMRAMHATTLTRTCTYTTACMQNGELQLRTPGRRGGEERSLASKVERFYAKSILKFLFFPTSLLFVRLRRGALEGVACCCSSNVGGSKLCRCEITETEHGRGTRYAKCRPGIAWCQPKPTSPKDDGGLLINDDTPGDCVPSTAK